MRFDVVDMETSFNAILGRTILNRLCAAVHHNFLCMKIPSPKCVITVRGEQSSDRKTLYRHETKCAEKGEASKSVRVLSGTGESKTDHPERYIPKPLPEGELMRTSHMLIHPQHLQSHYKDLSQELAHANLIIRYFRFLERFFTYMRI